MALTTSPTSASTKIPPHLFRVVLLRRSRLPLPLSPLTCSCGRPIDSFGHHRVSCARTGASGRRRCTLESEAARVYREAGERVTTNAMVRNLDLPVPDVTDSRRWRLSWMDCRCSLVRSLQWTRRCSLHSEDSPHNGARPGGAQSGGTQSWWDQAVARVLLGWLWRWVVGGQRRRATFVALLAKSKARQEPRFLQKRAEQTWRTRWGAILSCAAAKAVATCLLELKCAHGADGDTPLSWEVKTDHRHARLAA